MATEVLLLSLLIEGFGSIQAPVKFELDRGGITRLQGATGSGKTTLFSALAWVLYGINLKGTSNDSIATWEPDRIREYRGTRVVLELAKGETTYLVARHLSFKGLTMGVKPGSKLLLYEGDQLLDFQYKDDTQAEIIRLLDGMDAKSFLNSVVFGQRMKRLVEADNDEKRKLFDSMFELDFIKTAQDNAKAMIQGLQERQRVELDPTLVVQHNNALQRLEEAEGRASRFVEDKQERLTQAAVSLTKAEDLLVRLQEGVKELQKRTGKAGGNLVALNQELVTAGIKYEDTVSKHTLGRNRYKELNGELRSSEGRIQRFQLQLEEVVDICPTCEQPLAKDKVAGVRKALKADIKKEEAVVKVLTQQLEAQEKVTTDLRAAEEDAAVVYKKAQEAYTTADQEVKADKRYQQEVQDAEHAVTRQQATIDSIKARQQEIEAEQAPKEGMQALKQAQQKLYNKLAEQDALRSELQKQLGHLQWWSIKGLGASGLRAYVFNAMLAQLNAYAGRYSDRLGFTVFFSVDLSKASKPFQTTCYRADGLVVQYEELSGGEKQSVDICLAFAMHDLISHRTKLNVLVLDEVFEGLDREHIEIAYELIRQKAEGRSVYVITHSDYLDTVGTKTVLVEKHEGQTRIVA